MNEVVNGANWLPLLQNLFAEWQSVIQDISFWEAALLGITTLLWFFSGPVLSRFSHASRDSQTFRSQLRLFRSLTLLLLLSTVMLRFLVPLHDVTWITRLLSVLLIVILAYLAFHVIAYFLRKRFGKTRTSNGESIVVETYSSRLLTLFTALLLFILVIVSSVRVLGFDSLLEAGGVLGIIGVFLALTQASWAPDIISGLIILNSSMLEEGDVIELSGDDGPVLVVYKTKVFHTEFLNLVNNHRLMMRNGKLRDYTIHNLSSFASPKGLRECLTFNIDYAIPTTKVEQIFQAAFDRACRGNQGMVECQHGMEARLLDAGDYALKWGFFYYTKDIKQLLKTRQTMMLYVHEAAVENRVSLATPMLAQVHNA